jgi:hypothetical protein
VDGARAIERATIKDPELHIVNRHKTCDLVARIGWRRLGRAGRGEGSGDLIGGGGRIRRACDYCFAAVVAGPVAADEAGAQQR